MDTATTPHANGHARPVTLAPLRLPERGPGQWRPERDDPGQLETPLDNPGQDAAGQSRTTPDRPKRLALAMSAFRRNWWRLVFASVGAVAAVVSYGHIVSLFLSWHASSLDAHLMPVAIDGLIVIGAGAARSGQVWLGWSAIGPGLAASLYANVMNGLPYGRGAAMGSGWATVALFLATNVMERWKGAQVVIPRHDGGAVLDSGGGQGEVADRTADSTAILLDNPEDSTADSRPDKAADKIPSRKVTARTGRDRAADIIRRHPDWDNAKVAGQADCDVRTVRRARNDLTPKEAPRP